ncbi:MAG: hydroxymethylglutaryl-CoA reductase, degradative [Gammaproteobacteria bacterium]|nr:hydroxymethylglutaryl-CoA reductase, degradative [Gammaproteobacteria bacterium]MDE0451372.1 hydroxymethylglutaryl-CoA reductase, degradative [Gammaproteobacteria bacterium]
MAYKSDSSSSSQGSTPPATAAGSRISGFFKLPINDRIAALRERGLLTDEDVQALTSGEHTLKAAVADRMIENVVGVLGLPFGVALNFLVNGKDYIVPLSVEEPSIVAGLSGAARTARLSGGFTAVTTDPVLIGQVQVVDFQDARAAMASLLAHKDEIVDLANRLHPNMVARGGGARDIEAFHHTAPEDGREMVVLHLLVDTRDAMGANLVNGMCEGIAGLVEAITGGKVFLRILSNLTDRALVRASVRIPVHNLDVRGYSDAEVRDGIILASDLALVDPYRAATHNKGIMNGVDAVAIATGNDFRAIEAAAHAYAARDGKYRGLTRWSRNSSGDLVGEIDMPMKVGTVGGALETNPTVRIAHRLLGSPNATELAGVMGAVGLAQNYAALRSLATAGIQQHHMTLHARSVASAAGAPEELFDTIVEALVESGEIKVWKAREIVERMQRGAPAVAAPDSAERSAAHGKVILSGEHAVVYGRSALAAPIPLAVEARVLDARDDVHLMIPNWGLEERIRQLEDHPRGFAAILAMLLKRLDLADRPMTIQVFPHVPLAKGLGGSSAMAVAVIRALDAHYALELSDSDVNGFAFECETAAHGTPSGVDNTVATYGEPVLYRNPGTPEFHPVAPARPIPMVIGICGRDSLTSHTVAQVRAAHERQPGLYEAIFDQIESLTQSAAQAVRDGALDDLGELMNLCHGSLNALQLSTPELEEMVHIARSHGAKGAKLTGGGGGGSIIALCPDSADDVVAALATGGFKALKFEIN